MRSGLVLLTALVAWSFSPLISTAGPTAGSWVAQGPAPVLGGANTEVVPNDEVVGAIQAVVAHPSDSDVLYIGGVGGGVWRTDDATAAVPTWTPLTDALRSLSIGALAMDPTDSNRLVAGIGRFSNFAQRGGARSGLLLTTDGGSTWTELDGSPLAGENFAAVVVRGNLILAAADGNASGDSGGLFRSSDGGASFVRISGLAGSGLPDADTFDVSGDPSDPSRFFVAVEDTGIFESTDSGGTWTNISSGDATLDVVITDPDNDNTKMSVAGTGRLFVGVILDEALQYVGFSDDQGASWSAMDLPQTQESDGDIEGIHPGTQGDTNFAIIVDPGDPDLVYVAGDRQDRPFPNFIGAPTFEGRLFRGDASVAPTGGVPSPQWEHLTHSDSIAAIPGGGTANGTAPHPDSRGLAFDAGGDLLEVDDGGIYRRTSPRDNTGDWFDNSGNLQVMEFHDLAYDTISDILIGGSQDNATPEQMTTAGTVWRRIGGGDGGDVVVDTTSLIGSSIRYSSNQRLASFQRRTCDAANSCGASTFIGLNTLSGTPLTTGTGGNAQFVTPLALNVVDPTRLIIGGANSVYESFDQGDNVSEITGPGANRNAMAYGHAANPDVIWIGSGSAVFVRTTAAGNLVATAGAFPGGFVRDVLLDPADVNTVYAVDFDQVFQTTDGGVSWNDITGDLADTGAEDFRSLEYAESGANDRLVVGTNLGAFVSLEGSFGFWFPLGSGLPNSLVFDLHHDPLDDVLAAALLGRGAWTLADLTTLTVPPVAICQDVTVPTEPGVCSADASVDGGSFDPDDGPIDLTQVPPGPYGLGMTDVTLVVTDSDGASDSCSAEVTVVDQEPPMILCNAPPTITPPDAPISFTSSAVDNCSVASVLITEFDCFKFTKAGTRIDKTGSCEVTFEGATITILDSGGVHDHIMWTVSAVDGSGNPAIAVCEVLVVNPGRGHP